MRFSDDHVRMIREGFPECGQKEFEKFLFNAERLELDPLLGQIQLISRKFKDARGEWHTTWQTLLGRDAYRILAERTGEIDGSETIPNFDGSGNLVSATATVWRRGKGHAFKETVYLAEYRPQVGEGQRESPFWKNKPITMLSKVAEAQALRKAFPVLLTGTYAVEEFDSSVDRETGEVHDSPPPSEKKPSETNGNPPSCPSDLRAALVALTIDPEGFGAYLVSLGQIGEGGSLEDLPEAVTRKLLLPGALEKRLPAYRAWEGVQIFDIHATPELASEPPAERLARAESLRGKVTLVGPGRYEVPSQAAQGKRYLVTEDIGGWGCTCDGYNFRVRTDPGYQCVHIMAARLAEPELKGK